MRTRLFLAVICLGTLVGAISVLQTVSPTTQAVTTETPASANAPDPSADVRLAKASWAAARPRPTTTTTVPVRATPRRVVAVAVTHPAVRHVAVSYGGWTQPWACIAHYESGGNPAENTGNGYWGGLQFAPSTWWAYARRLGITVPAYEASIPQQEAVANLVLAAAGWGQWPNTSRACGYR